MYLVPSHDRPGIADERAPKLVMNVVSTSKQETSAALAAAFPLASALNAFIRVVVFRIVPYPLDLNHPVVSPFRTAQSCISGFHELPANSHISIYYCRDVAEGMRTALAPATLVLVGRKKCWWQRGEGRVIRLLRSQGHVPFVIEAR